MIRQFFKYLLLSLTSFFLCNVTVAQSKHKKSNTAEKNDASALETNALLWEISGNGIKKPSYVLGTIHIICKDDYFWSDAMEKAFNETDIVCLEMDLDNPKLQMEMAQSLMLTDGSQLPDYFEQQSYKLLQQYFEKKVTTFPVQALPRLKPTAVMMLLMTSNYQCSETESYEMNIMQKAKATKKEVVGLETMNAQMQALESMNNDDVMQYIEDVINNKNTQNTSQQLTQMTQLYTAQDIQGMYKMTESDTSMSYNMEALLHNRNRNWIPVMQEYLKENSVLFAVGAAHLAGDEGVLNLLLKAGYTIRPVR